MQPLGSGCRDVKAFAGLYAGPHIRSDDVWLYDDHHSRFQREVRNGLDLSTGGAKHRWKIPTPEAMHEIITNSKTGGFDDLRSSYDFTGMTAGTQHLHNFLEGSVGRIMKSAKKRVELAVYRYGAQHLAAILPKIGGDFAGHYVSGADASRGWMLTGDIHV